MNGFVGTTDKNPLLLKVNNYRATQYAYVEDTSDLGNAFRALNAPGGSEINSIAPGVTGATIAEGGQDYFNGANYPNTVTDVFGTVVESSILKRNQRHTTIGTLVSSRYV